MIPPGRRFPELLPRLKQEREHERDPQPEPELESEPELQTEPKPEMETKRLHAARRRNAVAIGKTAMKNF